MTLSILEACYYYNKHEIDCTNKMRSLVVGDTLTVVANNDLVGDPLYGKRKKLRVRYILDGREREMIVLERCRLKIGEPKAAQHLQPQPVNDDIEEMCEEVEVNANAIRITAAVEKVEKPGLTDIIIPSYNNEHLTIACFESIKACTTPGEYRIIWVDNGSKDKRKVKAALKEVNHLAIMLKKNTGFVGAINAGLAKSDAPTVCFLNNDTEVSPGWLDKLTDLLYLDSKLGIIGPLTGPPAIKQQYDSHHNIAYQQMARELPVFPYYKNLADFNKKIEAMQLRLVGDISFVAFLCAVIKREVIEKVTAFHPSYAKGLDAGYDMGMWDDCDYNWAIERVGYKKAIALDTCIIHKGRSTFKILQEKEKLDVDKLLKKNRKYMDKKKMMIENELAKNDDIGN